MKKILHVLAWALLAANLLWMIFASFYFVNTKDGFQILGKTQLTLVDTFADTRDWKPADEEAHPLLHARLESARLQRALADMRSRPDARPPAEQPLPPLPPAAQAPPPHPDNAAAAPQDPHDKSIFGPEISRP